ncbi:pollen receptor-like kinase 3 [Impatiens glandulifera]|uniref:pollen receptor-like kinase 3 n=1 Tax=Impatiens glandulifera TaxID=253017 RepID=UPI001FB07B71|nr:pollen receptor-like kinase 3 [Impatiens glandulifera]
MLSIRLLPLLLLFSPSLSLTDNDALLKLKKSFTGNTNALITWKPNTNPCLTKWTGVMCQQNVINGLLLPGIGLSGTIDIDALLQLTGLRRLSLTENSFSGPIPDFNRLGSLKALLLTRNKFSGEIPPDYFKKMGSLKKVWLSGNNFSGKIPDSLGQIPTLMELHLENNHFSGPIPPLPQASLLQLNVSYNSLTGPIPDNLSKFPLQSYEGNLNLCGNPLTQVCSPDAVIPQSADPTVGTPSRSWKIIVWFLGLVFVILAIVIIVNGATKPKNEFKQLPKDNVKDKTEVRVHSSTKKGAMGPTLSSRKGSTRKGSQKGPIDLVIVNESKGIFGLADLMKASAEVLGGGGLGSTYKAVMSNGVSVVVKRIREMNKFTRDAFDIEIRRLVAVKHPNLLPILSYHYRKDEKLFVTEYMARGNLLYLLHGDRGASHAGLTWPVRLNIIKGIASGMKHLHGEFSSSELPHGNLKSSNVVIDQSFEPLLTDYAMYPLMNNNNQAFQSMFAWKSPEAILHQQVSQKSDVYCFGIVILEIVSGKFPSQYLSNQKGGIDVVQWARSAEADKKEKELIDPELANDVNCPIEQIVKVIRIGTNCVENEHAKRIDMKEVLRRIQEV